MLTAALFITARTWKQHRCPSTEEWIKKMVYICIYNGLLLSHLKKKEIMPFAATWMQREIIMLSEITQKEKDTHRISLRYEI